MLYKKGLHGLQRPSHAFDFRFSPLPYLFANTTIQKVRNQLADKPFSWILTLFFFSASLRMKRAVKNGATGSRQAYLNKSKYDPNRYKQEKDRISKETAFVMTSLCCRRCCEIIQWKVDYGKYTQQELARRCNLCQEKKVTLSYHRICQKCAEKKAVCAKCQKAPLVTKGDIAEDESKGEYADNDEQVVEQHMYDFVDAPIADEELQHLQGLNVRVLQRRLSRKCEDEKKEALGALRERERRTVLRKAAVREEEWDGDESL